MGTTSDALREQSGVAVTVTVAIEGFQYILTDGDPDLAWNAYQDVSDFAGYADQVDAVSGLSVHWDINQHVSPWKPFTEPGMVRFSVVPGTLSQAQGRTDIIGQTVFKRTGGTETNLAAEVTRTATSVTVLRADDFPTSAALYMGPETMLYSSRDTGTDVFTISTRGAFPAFATDTGARFTRSHAPLTATEDNIGIPALVSSEPRTWIGRWVAIWIHRQVGSNGAIDRIDSPNVDGTGALLAFAGQIAAVEDVDGATVFECLDVRARIYGTRLNRDPFKARIAEGSALYTGDQFTIYTNRNGTTGSGNALVVVVGTPATVNEIQAGMYSAAELGARINAWLVSERAAARILFNLTYDGVSDDGTHLRGKLKFSDATTTNVWRKATLTGSGAGGSTLRAVSALGWDGGAIEIGTFAYSADYLSDRAPSRFYFGNGGSELITLLEPRGTWVSQYTLLPSALRDPVNVWDGLLRFGDFGYLKAKRVSDTSFYVSGRDLEAFFPGDGQAQLNGVGAHLSLSVEDDVSLDVSQVLLVESTFKDLLLRVLFSTGTSGFNSATYGDLREQMSCGIPYSICGADFVAEVGNLACANTTLTALIDGATSFHSLFQADFVLRRCFFVWGGGRLRVNAWSTPTSGYASSSLIETTKAAPRGTMDRNRASVSESADFYNIVTIRYGIDAAGKFADELVLKDAVSIRAHGERATTIEARNTFRRVGAIGSPLDAVIDTFTGFFGYTSRPWLVVKRTIDFNRFETCTPGTVLTLTDGYVRSPATGLRYSSLTGAGGLQGFPGLVIGQSFDWGGTEFGANGAPPTVRPAHGEVEIMISPQRTIATYVPAAQVDDTAATSGYVAGTKVLTCYAHEHSETSEVADATRFVATDKVYVVEIDPPTAAAPLAWSDTVASQTGNTITLTTGLAGWDTTKKYRVMYDAYTTATSTQKAYCYQADDADGLIADLVQAYAFGFFGSSQSTTVTLSTGQEVPSRYATSSYGDGRPLSVGEERDVVRLANNLIAYKTAPQVPTHYTEVRNFTGGGTWQLVESVPIFLGMGGLIAGLSRLLSISPRMRSTTGGTASVRVTLARRRPTGATRDDVVRVGPYVSATYSTTTSANFVISTANTLDIAHCRLADGLLGGVAWLYVEIATVTEYTGLARCKLGALA